MIAFYCLFILIVCLYAIGYVCIGRYEKLIRDLQENKAALAVVKYHEKEFEAIDDRVSKKYTNLLIITDDMKRDIAMLTSESGHLKKDVERIEMVAQSLCNDMQNIKDNLPNEYPILKLKVKDVTEEPRRKPGRPRKNA